jgi:hypothetical protein
MSNKRSNRNEYILSENNKISENLTVNKEKVNKDTSISNSTNMYAPNVVII